MKSMSKFIRKLKREKEKEINFFREFIKIKKHFFNNFNKKLSNVKDKRNQSYIIYDPELILFIILQQY